MCVYSDLSCQNLSVFLYGNWAISNKKVWLIGYCLHLCLWRAWIGLRSNILVVRKKRIWRIDQTVLICMVFWWVGTSFYGMWGIFPGGSLGWIKSRLYICVLVVQILVYVILLVLRLGGLLWWCLLGPHHGVLFRFCQSIVLAEVSTVVK